MALATPEPAFEGFDLPSTFSADANKAQADSSSMMSPSFLDLVQDGSFGFAFGMDALRGYQFRSPLPSAHTSSSSVQSPFTNESSSPNLLGHTTRTTSEVFDQLAFLPPTGSSPPAASKLSNSSGSSVSTAAAATAAALTISADAKSRKHATISCTVCKAGHRACSGGRPCERCIRLGIQDQCVDVVQRKRGRKGAVDPLSEGSTGDVSGRGQKRTADNNDYDASSEGSRKRPGCQSTSTMSVRSPSGSSVSNFIGVNASISGDADQTLYSSTFKATSVDEAILPSIIFPEFDFDSLESILQTTQPSGAEGAAPRFDASMLFDLPADDVLSYHSGRSSAHITAMLNDIALSETGSAAQAFRTEVELDVALATSRRPLVLERSKLGDRDLLVFAHGDLGVPNLAGNYTQAYAATKDWRRADDPFLNSILKSAQFVHRVLSGGSEFMSNPAVVDAMIQLSVQFFKIRQTYFCPVYLENYDNAQTRSARAYPPTRDAAEAGLKTMEDDAAFNDTLVNLTADDPSLLRRTFVQRRQQVNERLRSRPESPDACPNPYAQGGTVDPLDIQGSIRYVATPACFEQSPQVAIDALAKVIANDPLYPDMPLAVWDMAGRLLHVNGRLCSLMELTPQQLLYERVFVHSLLQVEDVGPLVVLHLGALCSNMNRYEVIAHMQKASGEKLRVRISVDCMRKEEIVLSPLTNMLKRVLIQSVGYFEVLPALSDSL
ncbi:hypothetical protein CAOG_02369 [Capsaspora owczarzaki ATCC 30864]|uniref:Zn(2)-C6 fungal-type domain-containing protein n=1 Tax=Capsaspora owczarzaki (strain ATCC 30864) TaxID=595528 RepID=A0A0D2X1Q2_CAPO3|nr:hypothetical protein CAOG_02369 [Capsaspora owczarzaki ATCC 30864]KJE91203.1 hypothetical protein CAOG_002369 [Capsaspora owczarzaki ATCC 30864]KJE91204.1 hypothetical protein, variant [Capsaspora owczarzaki ATCC 30864]|eukprot:XP_004349119.1 hypothetical protein CAOG_02369 [Capsaspora owczarzaki ATCC 30864]